VSELRRVRSVARTERSRFQELPRQDEKIPLSFDTRRQIFYRQQHHRSFSDFDDPMISGDKPPVRESRPVHEILESIDYLLKLHQMEWRPSNRNPLLLYFPFMFVVPRTGWQLRNLETRDVYTIKSVGTDKERRFTGAILLEGGLNPPGFGTGELTGRWDRLEIIQHDEKVVRFHVSWPEKEALESQAPPAGSDEGATYSQPFTPTVTSLLVRQEPGTIGKREFDPAKMAKPKVAGYEPDPFDPISYSLELQWQYFENIIQFDCWSPLNEEADRLADWFQTFMNLYTWVLKLAGVAEIRYWQRRADLAVPQSFRDALPRRSLQYYFRTNMVTPVRKRNLTQVHINARLHHGTGSIPAPGETGGGLVTQWDRFHDDSGNWLGGTITRNDTRNFIDSFLNP
jgi:hypothetical protein